MTDDILPQDFTTHIEPDTETSGQYRNQVRRWAFQVWYGALFCGKGMADSYTDAEEAVNKIVTDTIGRLLKQRTS